MKHTYLIIFLTLLIASVSEAQLSSAGYDIHLKSVTVTPEGNAQHLISSGIMETETFFRSGRYKVIQFDRIPVQAEKELLKQAGVELLDYLPQMAYFASFSINFDAKVMRDLPIRSILEVKPEYKLDKLLYNENYPAHAMTGNNRIRLVVSYYPDLKPDDAAVFFNEKGLKVTGRDDFSRLVYVEAGIGEISAIASLPWVMFIEAAAADPQPENYTGRTLHHTNAIATDFLAGRHYDGTGVNAVLQDDGVIGPHIDYQGRIGAQFLSNNNGDHGDHCAGILMGGGNRDPRAKGNGFGSTLWVYSTTPNYPGFTAIPTTYTSLGIRVTSASYGDGCNAGYTSLTRTLDQQVRMYPSLMHVFSAGNSGSDNCGYGAGAGWGNITGGHKQGKNVLAVANLDFQDVLASSSSRGPAHDGRIKPDVGAKGSSVVSTINPNTYGNKSGTSMACPGVAGTLTQLIHAYRELNNGQDPMAGLLKATLLNTAEDLGNPGPDFKFGWGRINALRAVQVFEQGRYDSGVVSQGMAGSHTISVPPNTARIQVMVYWTDYEASVNTNWALVNNLNMTVTDPSSATWLPWVLSHYANPDSLNKVAVRGTDNRNNMEQVTIDDPQAGDYVVDVQGITVPQGPQTYYVVWEFVPETVTLTYPAGGESMVPGEQETIRWDAFGASEPFTIEFSSDNGQAWDTVVANHTAAARYYNWTVPSVVTGNALIRVSRGGSVSQCEAAFSIMGVPCNLVVDWACDTALHLSWGKVGGATSYEVFKLGQKYMESVGVTNITSFIVSDTNQVTSNWLSVRALGSGGATGRRALAIEKTPGNLNCRPVDAMLASAPTAQWGVFQACLDLQEVNLPVGIRNFGLEPIVNPSVSWQLDNGTIATEAISATILPDSTFEFIFPQKLDLSSPGSHVFRTWVTYPQDQNPANDSLVIPIEVIDGVTFPAEGSQDFETWTKCLSSPVCELYTCELADGWINLANTVHDFHDWRTFSGSTPTAGTGPDTDHTLGTTAGKYLYVEPTMYCLNREAYLATPCIDLTGSVSAKASLWYHAFGADIGSFHADVFDGTAVSPDVVTAISGSKGDEWRKLEIDLTPWAGKVIGLRFRAMTGCADKGDFAIDDFSLEQVMVSVEDKDFAATGKLKVFPNPASGEVTIALREAGTIPYRLLITDLYGRTVLEQLIEPRGGRIYEQIRLPEVAGGFYLVEVKSDRQGFISRLVVRPR